MKPFKINKNSWHYKMNMNFLNENTEKYWLSRHPDFCSYWRSTFFRLVVASFMSIFIMWLASVLFLAAYNDPYTTVITFGVVILSLIILITGIFIAGDLKKRNTKFEYKPESIFMQKYRANKEKICPMIEYVD